MKNCKLCIFGLMMLLTIPAQHVMGDPAGFESRTLATAIQDEKSAANIGDSHFDIMVAKLKASQKKTRFTPSSPEALRLAEQLFTDIFQGKPPATLAPTLTRLNLIMEIVELDASRYLLLMEAHTHRRGRGFYIFPATGTEFEFSNQVLMIPHGFYDYHTGDIGIHLMLEGQFAAAAFNTVHRYGNRKLKGVSSNEIWDMADLFDTFFSAFTKAFVRTHPAGHLIQLHGFSRKKRNTDTGRNSDIIISNGTAYPSQALTALCDCVKIKLPGITRLYPMEINALGGTQNTIGKVMRSMDHPGFIHLEMSLSMRKKMTYDHDIRNRFLSCLEKL
ncbi:hypothetical protein [uncultured Desulfobacter sp.]|uniref:hypothetical protein n=1 Tax=uncultured Desulfobacter sp. TaxID=240139 RepID=UPI0029C60F52|nr:hypothetical protein [uncultured Desulfobacter sp.]